MYYVYVLKSSKNGDLYKGFSTDLKRRLEEHNAGTITSTKSGVPWKLIYYEAFANESDARKEEIFLKTGRGRDRLHYLLDNTK